MVGTLAGSASGGSVDSTTWTVIGTGAAADSGDGGHAREAEINQPRAVSALPDGGYVWAEPYAHRVRVVGSDGIVRRLAGTGEPGFGGDGGKATDAKLNFVHTAVPTADGGFLLADTWNSRIRKISPSGIITTVAGTGAKGFGGDGGPATRASLNHPRSVAALPDGGFLIPDSGNHRVRKVSPSGIITTVAGVGAYGFSGDGGPAVAAQLNLPFAVDPTDDGGFLVADIENQRIRKVSADGIIATVAGNGTSGFSGDGGPATAGSLRNPHSVVAMPDGGFLIADTDNQRVRRVDAAGTITTLIGDGIRGDEGDGGNAGTARLSAPKGIGITDRGDVLVADEQNNRIRFVGAPVGPTNLALPEISGELAQGRQLTASSGVWHGTGPQLGYQWQRCSSACAAVPGAVAKVYTVTAADTGSALRVEVTASNPAGDRTVASLPTPTLTGSPVTKPPSTPSGTAPTQPTQTTPGAKRAAPALVWLVQAGANFQRVQEYTVRQRNTRLSDAILAFGKPSCRAVGPGHVVASWASRGIRIDSRAARPLPAGTTGCTSPSLIHVREIRLSDSRWRTSLGLRIGDTAAKLRRLYPRSAYVRAAAGSSGGEYYLVWRHVACTGSCTSRAQKRGVNIPRLTAQVKDGKVTGFRLPVSAAAQGR